MFETLKDVEADLKQRFVQAAKDRRSPMHVPAVVTSDVSVRGMVLRAFDEEAWTLRFHTDTRAPKAAAIEADPRMAVLFYDEPSKIQIRAKGKGTVVRDGALVEEAWNTGPNFARRCYLGQGPGALSQTPTSGLPAEYEGIEPSDEQLVPARENFAVLLMELTEVDWLYLAHTGHMRAQFAKDGAENWEGNWVTP